MFSTITPATPGASVIEVAVHLLLLGAAICLCAAVVLTAIGTVSRLRRRAGPAKAHTDTTTTGTDQPPTR